MTGDKTMIWSDWVLVAVGVVFEFGLLVAVVYVMLRWFMRRGYFR